MIPAHIADWANKKRKKDMGFTPSYTTPLIQSSMFTGPNADKIARNSVTTPTPTTIQAKGGGAPKVPSAQEQAQAQMQLEQQRATIAEQQRVAQEQRDAEAKRQLGIQAGNTQNSRYTSAVGYGKSQLGSKGYDAGLLDKYNVMDQYTGELGNQRQGFDPYDTNAQFNTGNAMNTAINNAQGTYRNDTTKGINAITGQGFENNLIGDTMDDSILNTILNKQNDEAANAIETAHSRGMLNDIGYSAALQDLGTSRTAGMGQLQQIGQGVLGNYRTGLTNARNQALSTAGGLTLADLYDMDAYNKNITGQVEKDKGGLEGDIYNAVGSQRFFDPNKMIAMAGAGQGYFNPGRQAATDTPTGGGSPLLDQMTDAEKKRTSPTSQVF